MSRMLKELRNLTPWQWDKKGAQPGAKGLQDFEKLEQVLHGNDSSKTRREPGKELPSAHSRDSPTTAENQTPATPFTVTTAQPRSAGASQGSRATKRRAALSEAPTMVMSPPAGPHSAQPFKVPRTASKTPGQVGLHKPSPASAPVHAIRPRLQRGSSGSIGAVNPSVETPKPAPCAAQQGRPKPISVDATPMPQLKGVLTPGTDVTMPSSAQLISAERAPATAPGEPSPCMVTTLQLANMCMDSSRKPGQNTEALSNAATSALPSPQGPNAERILRDKAAAVPATAAGMHCSNDTGAAAAEAEAQPRETAVTEAAAAPSPGNASRHLTAAAQQETCRQAQPADQQQQQQQQQLQPLKHTNSSEDGSQDPMVADESPPHPSMHASPQPAMPSAAPTAACLGAPGDDDPWCVEAAQSLMELLLQPPKGPGSDHQATSTIRRTAMGLARKPPGPTESQHLSAHAMETEQPGAADDAGAPAVQQHASDAPGNVVCGTRGSADTETQLLPSISMDVDSGPANFHSLPLSSSPMELPQPAALVCTTMQLADSNAISASSAPPAQTSVPLPIPAALQPSSTDIATLAVHVLGYERGADAPSFAAWHGVNSTTLPAQQSSNVSIAVTTAVADSLPTRPVSSGHGALPEPPVNLHRAGLTVPGKPARARRASKDRQGPAASYAHGSSTRSHPGVQRALGAGIIKPAGNARACRPQVAASRRGHAAAVANSQGFDVFSPKQHFSVNSMFSDTAYRTSCSDPGTNYAGIAHQQGCVPAPASLLPSCLPASMLSPQQQAMHLQPMPAALPQQMLPQQQQPMQFTSAASLQEQQQQEGQSGHAGSALTLSLFPSQLQHQHTGSAQAFNTIPEPGMELLGLQTSAQHLMSLQNGLPQGHMPTVYGSARSPASDPGKPMALGQPIPTVHAGLPVMHHTLPTAYQYAAGALSSSTQTAADASLNAQSVDAAVWGPSDCTVTQVVARYCAAVGLAPTPANIHQVQGMVSALKELPMESAQQMLQQLQIQMASYPGQAQAADCSGISLGMQSGQLQDAAPTNGGQGLTGAANAMPDQRSLDIAPLTIPTASPVVDAEWTMRLDPTIVALYSSLLEGHRALRDAALSPQADKQGVACGTMQQQQQQQQAAVRHAAATSNSEARRPPVVTTGTTPHGTASNSSTPRAPGSNGSTPRAFSTTGTARSVTSSMLHLSSIAQTTSSTAARPARSAAPTAIPVPPAIPLSSITTTLGAHLGPASGLGSTPVLKPLDVNRPRRSTPAPSWPAADKPLKVQQAVGNKGLNVASRDKLAGGALLAGFATHMPASLNALTAAHRLPQVPSLAQLTVQSTQPALGLPLAPNLCLHMGMESFPGFSPSLNPQFCTGHGLQANIATHLGVMPYGAANTATSLAAGPMVTAGVIGVTLPSGA